MNKHLAIGLIALLVLVAVVPVYALREAGRMAEAEAAFMEQYVADGSLMYVENCLTCHGSDGEGVGAMPALNNPALARADAGLLYRIIAYSPHGTTMAAWHVEEGGVLTAYQVKALVALIQSEDWSQASQLADLKGIVPPAPARPVPPVAEALDRMAAERSDAPPGLVSPDVRAALLGDVPQDDPHACSACHEEPDVHVGQFGLECARCHGLVAWQPALLTRHIFELDHGGEGQVACETCHVDNYYEHTCYSCHDHQPAEMQTAHAAEGIYEYDNCIQCHPTGRPGEGEQFQRVLAQGGEGGVPAAGHVGLQIDIQPLGSSIHSSGVASTAGGDGVR
jgi:mono/diheme cytochrome c family protein